MAEADIPSQGHLSKKSLPAIAPSAFEVWATSEGYNTAPAVLPCPLRQYADRGTQKAFVAWNAGGSIVAQMVTESTLETEALRDKLKALACNK
jgi:hypothetical protein